MQRTRRRDTPGELDLRRRLHALGLRYRVDVPVIGRRRRADIVFRPARVAVFVDGCFWHRCPVHGTLPKSNEVWWREKLEGNVARDRDTDTLLRSADWEPIRVWAHEDMGEAARRIERVVRERH